ncbi:MAG: phage tail sheath C-terminal domain-containing protein [Ferruginibacter sp.]
MATVYKTPGVYVEEIPKLPPSVAQVETAIPAFVGYTEKAEKNGESLINIPTRISSMIEFIQYYGGERKPESISVSVDDDNNYAVLEVTLEDGEQFYLYNSMRLFFDNGGGDCYIVSVGLFENNDGTNNSVLSGDENDPVNSRGLRVGVKALEKYDEPTIILFPDAVLLPEPGEFYSLQQMAISQCAKLQDRVSVLDLREATADDVNEAAEEFRNNIGINSLKYAAAYTPWLYTTYPKEVDFEQFSGNVEDGDGNPITDLTTLTSDNTINALVTTLAAVIEDNSDVQNAINAICDADTSNGTVNAAAAGDLTAQTTRDVYKIFSDALKASTTDGAARTAYNNLITFVRESAERLQTWKTDFSSSNLTNDVNTYAVSASLWKGGVIDLIKIEKNTDGLIVSGVANAAAVDTVYGTLGIDIIWLGITTDTSEIFNDIDSDGTEDDGKDYDNGGAITDRKTLAIIIEKDIRSAFEKIALFADTIVSSAQTYKKAAQDNLYEKHTIIGNIVKNIKKELSLIPPCGAVAGIYARVDNARGVWKAPANESINSVTGPSEQITADDQSNLNVDAVAGKSINAIRSFTGKGTLIWGARTLAGNDNEWRYVSVRRFFNMVEESCKKATEPFVFEPNDANTWVKVQGMIENFLTTLWRQGALQGIKPEHAFYVAVGLGKTMTALDILEGRMIIEIGMAAVRPAEFIILRFSHKMAES